MNTFESTDKIARPISSTDTASLLLADSGAYACPASPVKESGKVSATILGEMAIGAGAGAFIGLPEVGAVVGLGLGLYFSYKGEKSQYPNCVLERAPKE